MDTSESLPSNVTVLRESVEHECEGETGTLPEVIQRDLSTAALQDELSPARDVRSCPSGDEIGIALNKAVADRKLEYDDTQVGHAIQESSLVPDAGPPKDLVQDLSQDTFEDALSELEYSSCVSLDLTTDREATVKDVGTQSEKFGFDPGTSNLEEYKRPCFPAASSPQVAFGELASRKMVDKCPDLNSSHTGAGHPTLDCARLGACNKHASLLPDEYDRQYQKVLSTRLQQGRKSQEPALCGSCSRSMMQYISAIQGLLQNLSIDMMVKGNDPPACSWCAREKINQAFQNPCRSDTDISSVFSPNVDSDLPISCNESLGEQDTSPRSPRDRRGHVGFTHAPASSRLSGKSPDVLPGLMREYRDHDRDSSSLQKSPPRELAYNDRQPSTKSNQSLYQPWHSAEGGRSQEQSRDVHHDEQQGACHKTIEPHEQDQPIGHQQVWTQYHKCEETTSEKQDRDIRCGKQQSINEHVVVDTGMVEQPPNLSSGRSLKQQIDLHQRNGFAPDALTVSSSQPCNPESKSERSEDLQQHSLESLRTKCTEPPMHHPQDMQGRPSELPLQVHHSNGRCSDTSSSNESGNVTGKAAVHGVPRRRHSYPVRRYASGAGQVEELVQQDLIEPCKPTVNYQAYVTMASNDLSAMLSLVLGNSLRVAETTRSLVVLITDGVSPAFRHMLSSVFNVVLSVRSLGTHGTTKLALLEQPDIGVSFTKLHAWRLTQFSKCVFLDAATLVVQHCDELFDRDELSAVPDIGWPDCFNSGVFVYVPSMETFWDLISFAERQGSFDGGDQGLLNMYFRNWSADISRRLPFIYNLMANVSYTYKPAFKQFGKDVKIVQFFGGYKPWNVKFHPPTGQMSPAAGVHPNFAQFVQLWLHIFVRRVLPMFSQSIQDKVHRAQYICVLDLLQHFPSFLTSEPVVTLPTPSFRSHPKPIVYLPPGPRSPPETEQPHTEQPAEVQQPHLDRSIIVLSPQPPVEEVPPPPQAPKQTDLVPPLPPQAPKQTDSPEVGTTSECKDMPEDTDGMSSKEDSQDKEQEAVDDLSGMLAWEQGRADYMGEHKSDNIMARLDRLISGVPE